MEESLAFLGLRRELHIITTRRRQTEKLVTQVPKLLLRLGWMRASRGAYAQATERHVHPPLRFNPCSSSASTKGTFHRLLMACSNRPPHSSQREGGSWEFVTLERSRYHRTSEQSDRETGLARRIGSAGNVSTRVRHCIYPWYQENFLQRLVVAPNPTAGP